MRARSLLLVLATALGACSGTRGAALPAEGEAEARGGRLYRARCTACHRAYEPESRTGAEWTDALRKMAPRAHLTEAERAAILDFLASHARDAGGAR